MKFRSSLSILLCALTATLAACNPSAEDICKDRLPELEQSLSNALTVLKDWQLDVAGRALASTEEQSPRPKPRDEPKLPDVDRKAWQDWAQGHLFETQKYIDQVPADPRLRISRASLNTIANTFVTFHGYASESRLGPMVRSLEVIRGESAKIQSELCVGQLAPSR